MTDPNEAPCGGGVVSTDDDGFPNYDQRDSTLIEQLDNLGDQYAPDEVAEADEEGDQ